ncbi:MAG: bifunctional hydroxymethylpyrimidine kinase/phosphomethylpyrimidine kinase [Beijerinckiaceae bacterium]
MPIALTIAGSDSGGGAGIQADLKTFSALGVYGASVVTALTAQNTLGVQGVHAAPPEFIALQMRSVFSDLAVDAVKIGMLADPDTIDAVARELPGDLAGRIVLDPVMVAASGDRLVSESAAGALVLRLFPKAAVVTPNLHEAAALLGGAIARSEEEMAAQGRALLAKGPAAVLMKGGHGTGAKSVDLLVTPDGVTRFAAMRIATDNTHGTGCTLASAIAANLAKGAPLVEAVGSAKDFVTAAIVASGRLKIGQGRGPTHHFHAWW